VFAPRIRPELLEAVTAVPPEAPDTYSFTWTTSLEEYWASELPKETSIISQISESSEEGNEINKVKNPVKELFFSLLRSKDDNLIFLTTCMFQNLLNNTDVNKQLLW